MFMYIACDLGTIFIIILFLFYLFFTEHFFIFSYSSSGMSTIYLFLFCIHVLYTLLIIDYLLCAYSYYAIPVLHLHRVVPVVALFSI